MNVNQLEYFIAVVNEGSISAAAKRLHMSQPPLSNHMKLLEHELGCTLFERGARKIRLTEAGSILYNRANAVSDLLRSIEQEMESYKKGLTGTLRIGIVSSTGSIFLKNWLVPFQEAHPTIHYELVESDTYSLLEQLTYNRLDFAIVRTPFPSTSFRCIHLLQESLIAIGVPSYFKNKSATDTVSLSDLSSLPILLYRRWEAILRDSFEMAHLPLDIYCKCDDARTTLLWAKEGLGVAIVPASAKSLLDLEGLEMKKIESATLPSTITLIYNPKSYQSLVAKDFLKQIKSSLSCP